MIKPPSIEPSVIPIYKAVMFHAIILPRSFGYSTANLAVYEVNPAYPTKAHKNKKKKSQIPDVKNMPKQTRMSDKKMSVTFEIFLSPNRSANCPPIRLPITAPIP